MANKRINELALRTPQTTDLMLIGDPTTGYSYKTTLLSALNLGVPTTRTITINGTTFDLSANRTWSVGTVTSVGLTMPSAFNVASSPVTGSGTIAVTAAGLASQYIRGDGTLADFPGGGGGGGASVSYYLNGSVNQGTIGGIAFREMNKTPILGAGTNFTTNTNGYIASFITDPGDPALLKIPGGNWNTEFYFAASSGGGTPTYYLELYKYDGTTFTLIASNSSNPDAITGGTSVEQYFTTIPVPETVLTATDRLAIRIYVTTAGRTITLHTENSNLCQIITTFTTGLTALNGLTAQVQYFATGSAGTDFNISSSTATHTFNIPTASATNRGLLSTADWTTFNNKVPYTGATANVDLGIYNLSAKSVFIEGTASYQSGLAMKQLNSFDFVSGAYTQIAPSSTTELNLVYNQSGGARRRAALSAAVLQNGDNFQYLFPRQNGTFAMLTDISTAINGTTNWIPRFTSANTIGLSNLYDGSSFIGVFTATDNLSGAKLQVNGAATFSSSVVVGGSSGYAQRIFTAYADGTDFAATIQQNNTNGGGLQIYRNSASWGNTPFSVQTTTGTQLILNASGNLGLGVIPSAWTAGGSNIEVGAAGNIIQGQATQIAVIQNATFNSGWKYSGNGLASFYNQTSGQHIWYTAPSGTAGNAITFTQAMTLDASGRLLVGLNNVTGDRLQVSGNIYTNGTNTNIYLDNGGTGGASLKIGVTGTTETYINSLGDDPLILLTNNTERMRITSSGNVGIGTASPAERLHVAGAIISTGGITGHGANRTTLSQEGANGAFWQSYGANTSTMGAFVFRQASSDFSVVNTAMTITSSGRTLIGTTTDNTVDLLQVAGGGRFTKNGEGLRLQSADANGNYITFHNGSAAYGYVGSNYYLIGSGSASDLGILSQSNIVFSAGGATERMRITSGGNVGIGTTPAAGVRLQVAGGIITCLDVYNNTTAAAANMQIDANGNFARSTSSIKYKTDVRNYDKGLQEVMQMRPVYYKGKNDGNKQFAGLIAEEIDNLGMSEFVEYANDNTPDALAYSNMIALLTKAIQELKTELDTLKK